MLRGGMCRSPHGERGLKCVDQRLLCAVLCGRSPHGERGLKSTFMAVNNGSACRSPHGERGLKYSSSPSYVWGYWSLSSWRAWIEISWVRIWSIMRIASLSSWRAWIEMQALSNTFATNAGRSPHGERGLK